MSFPSHTPSSATTTSTTDIFVGSYFPSFTHLENAASEFAKQNGFSYVKRSSHKTDGAITDTIIICSKGYCTSKAKRADQSKAQLCPFKIRAILCPTTGFLKITTVINEHNHPLSELTAQFGTRNRRLTPTDMSDIIELRDANIKVADMLAIIANRSSKYVTNRQLYKVLSGGAQKKINGMSECGKLLEFVSSSSDLSGYYSAKESSTAFDMPLTSALICFNPNVQRFRKAPQVLLIDGTFGTNRFNLPITMFVSKDEHDIMYCIGFSLTDYQTTENYAWALRSFVVSVGEETAAAIEVVFTDRELALCNAIEQILPRSRRQLCQWHIRKDIASHISKRADFNEEAKMEYIKAFNGLISCHDFSKYPAVRDSLLEKFPLCADYTRSWLVHEKHFVECFISSNFNLGIRTTQGVESIHSSLKRFLDYTSVPLQTLVEAFLKKGHDSVDRALHALYSTLTSSQAFPQVLDRLRGTLSSPALLLTVKQIDALELKEFEVFSHEGNILVSPKTNRSFHNVVAYVPSGHSVCNCSFYAQYRLPCMHIVACFRQFSGVLTVNAVHSRWLVGTFNASIPLMPANTQQESSDESDSKDVMTEDTSNAIPEKRLEDNLFDEAFEAICLLCRKQRLGGVNASHASALQKALCVIQDAFGERRVIDSSAAQVSDIRQSGKRGRPSKQHRIRAANEDATRQLMDLTKTRNA